MEVVHLCMILPSAHVSEVEKSHDKHKLWPLCSFELFNLENFSSSDALTLLCKCTIKYQDVACFFFLNELNWSVDLKTSVCASRSTYT